MTRARLAALALACSLSAAAFAATDTDPWLWLEDIEGAKALAWVKAENAATDKLILNRPGFEQDRARAKAILDDDRQIADPGQVMGDTITNFWRDANHPRGIWRQSPLGAYLAGTPEWTTLIHVDALGKAEGQSWVWHGADCLAPTYTRCLVSLSPGGTDSDVVREWDRTTGRFVTDGFALPQAKSAVVWEDADTLLVATDYGEGSMTASGYPRIVKRWKRGTPLASAAVVAEGKASDVGINPIAIDDGKTRWILIARNKSFYTSDYSIRAADGAGFVPAPIPDTADLRDVIGGQAIIFLNKPADGFYEGSLVALSLADAAAGRPAKMAAVMAPTKAQAIDGALCHGWIDGRIDKHDDAWFLTRFTRRTAKSRWSEKNRGRVVELIADGRVSAAGVAVVEEAKADGRWDAAYAPASTATEPDDLRAALDADPPARAFFDTLTGANRYAILYRVHDAKRPETRAARIAKFVALCAAHRTLH